MHAGWWRTTRPRQCCSKAGHPRLAGLYLRRGNECVAVFPQLRSPAVPWISCAHEAGRRCQGAPHPPPPPLKGGDWIQPRTPAPSLASCSAVYPSCPRLSWALWVWLSGVSGPVCGQIGLGRASWRAASGAAGVQGHLGGSLGCRARMPCSCVFFPMLFGGPKAWEVHSCVHGAHTLPTPSATQILKCLCVFGSPGPVLSAHVSAYVCLENTCVQGACMFAAVCLDVECACVSVHADQHLGRRCVCMWGARVSLECLHGAHTCLCVRPGSGGPGAGADSPHQRGVVTACPPCPPDHSSTPSSSPGGSLLGVCVRVLWAGLLAAHGAEGPSIFRAGTGRDPPVPESSTWLEVCSLGGPSGADPDWGPDCPCVWAAATFPSQMTRGKIVTRTTSSLWGCQAPLVPASHAQASREPALKGVMPYFAA